MRKIYIVLLGLAVVLSALQSIFSIASGVVILALAMTVGSVALALVFLPLVAMGLGGLLPMVLMWRDPSRRRLGIGATIALLAAILFLPPFLSERRLDSIIQDTRQNAIPIDTSLITGVEIRRRSVIDLTLERGGITSRKLCDSICEQLLFGGDIDWVRVVSTNERIRRDGPEVTALFIRADPGSCQTLHPDMPDNEPCILYQPDTDDPAQLLLTFTASSNRMSWQKINPGMLSPLGIRQMRATLPMQTSPQTVFLQSQLFYAIPQPIKDAGIQSFRGYTDRPGWFYPRARNNTPAIDVVGQLTVLGLKLAPPRADFTASNDARNTPPEPWHTAQIISLLDAYPTGDAPEFTFKSANRWQIELWLDRASYLSTLAPTEARLLCRLQTDPRTQRLSWPGQLRTNITPACEG